jgi:carboxyl-terminal processing protease
MRRCLSYGFLLLFAIGLVGLGLLGGVVLDRKVLARFVPLPNMPAEAHSEFRLMAETWNVIQENYVGSAATEPRQITYGALQGMVHALGDEGHSRFLTPEQFSEHLMSVRGELEGIGVEIQMQDGRVVIVAPLDGSPAQEAGLRPGDIIMAVDGESVDGMSLEEVVGRVTGPAGTSISLTILDHETEETRQVSLTRARIALQNLTWQPISGTNLALVRLSSFSAGVSEELERALTAIHEQGLHGVVLDLRNNPGGLLSEAVATTSQFLETGDALLVRDAQGQTRPIPVEEEAVAPEIPVVLLINQGTASAAEIVTGALQDAERATVVGETTFGTGTVLMQFPLSDGSAILMATEEWLTPRGRVIWKQGIEPDVTVPLPGDALPLVPNGDESITPEEVESSQDEQLRAALELLMDMTAEASPPDGEASRPQPEADVEPGSVEGYTLAQEAVAGVVGVALAEGDDSRSHGQLPACQVGESCTAAEPAAAPAGDRPGQAGAAAPTAAGDSPVHILLVGGDNDFTPDMNTDSLIVLVLDRRGKRVSLLSIPRDLWVQIPGHGWGRINTAHRLGMRYAYADGGGPGLLARTIEENLGIPVDHWVRINYSGFAAAVDQLGGVEVAVACPVNLQYLPPAWEDEVEMILEPGVHLLDGETALRYVRTRRGETDFERAERQRLFLKAAWEQFKGPGVLRRVPGLWSALRGTFDTDLTLGDALRLAPLALQLRHQDVRSLAIGREQVQDWTTPGGARVLLPIPENVAQVVDDLYAPSPTAVPAATLPSVAPSPAAPASPQAPARVQVVNATAQPDLDGLLAAELRWHGLEAEEAGPGGGAHQERSTLLVYRDRPAAVELLSGLLHLRPEDVVWLPDEGQGPDLEIILGSDYNSCR